MQKESTNTNQKEELALIKQQLENDKLLLEIKHLNRSPKQKFELWLPSAVSIVTAIATICIYIWLVNSSTISNQKTTIDLQRESIAKEKKDFEGYLRRLENQKLLLTHSITELTVVAIAQKKSIAFTQNSLDSAKNLIRELGLKKQLSEAQIKQLNKISLALNDSIFTLKDLRKYETENLSDRLTEENFNFNAYIDGYQREQKLLLDSLKILKDSLSHFRMR